MYSSAKRLLVIVSFQTWINFFLLWSTIFFILFFLFKAVKCCLDPDIPQIMFFGVLQKKEMEQHESD